MHDALLLSDLNGCPPTEQTSNSLWSRFSGVMRLAQATCHGVTAVGCLELLSCRAADSWPLVHRPVEVIDVKTKAMPGVLRFVTRPLLKSRRPMMMRVGLCSWPLLRRATAAYYIASR